MALDIDPARIAEALRKNVETWTPSVEREEIGRVTETADSRRVTCVMGTQKERTRTRDYRCISASPEGWLANGGRERSERLANGRSVD